jgi:hypothetical protein
MLEIPTARLNCLRSDGTIQTTFHTTGMLDIATHRDFVRMHSDHYVVIMTEGWVVAPPKGGWLTIELNPSEPEEEPEEGKHAV